MELRDYQEKAVHDIRDSVRKGKKPVYVLPTGGGKSPVIAKIATLTATNGNKVLALVHRRNLVLQLRDTIQNQFGMEAGVIMSGILPNLDAKIQIGSIQTYGRRICIDDILYNPYFINANVLLIDEAHRTISKTYDDIIKLYEDKVIIGFTATPCRADGRGLGEVFSDIVVGPSVKELTDRQLLCPVRYFVPGHIDLQGVKVAMGDYQTKALSQRMLQHKLVGDIIDNWLRIAENRKTLVFCVDVKHAVYVSEQFNKAGIPSTHLDANSSDEEREAAFNKMQSGEIKVLCNVLLYVEGLDVPSIDCIVMARPTKSFGLYRQSAGRGLRVEEGKTDLIYLDHANVIETHGLLDWPTEWTLDGKKKAYKKPSKKLVDKLVKCRACGRTFEGSRTCPDCGTEVMSFGREIKTLEGDLVELTKKQNKEVSWDMKRKVYAGFLWYAISKNYNIGWAKHAYKEYFGVWPNDPRVGSAIPTEPFGIPKNILTHVLIKKAKSWRKKNGQ